MSHNLPHLNLAFRLHSASTEAPAFVLSERNESKGLSVTPSKIGGLVCAFSTRASGNMSLFYGDTKDALENRKNFLKDLGIDYRDLICAQQVHGSQARYIQETDKGKGALSYDTAIPDTDALITRERNLALAVFTADCLSVFLYDRKTPSIGLVHAGWRSTRDNIVGGTLKLMQEKFNTDLKDLSVGFGAVIRSCCYEVKRGFASIIKI